MPRLKPRTERGADAVKATAPVTTEPRVLGPRNRDRVFAAETAVRHEWAKRTTPARLTFKKFSSAPALTQSDEKSVTIKAGGHPVGTIYSPRKGVGMWQVRWTVKAHPRSENTNCAWRWVSLAQGENFDIEDDARKYIKDHWPYIWVTLDLWPLVEVA